MAFHGVPSQAALAGTPRPHANDDPGLFGYAVPSLKPLDAKRPTLRALANGMRLVDLNDNNAMLAARRHLAPPFRLVDVTGSRRGDRPVVAMRRPAVAARPWPDARRPSRPEFRILWNLGLVAVVALFLVAAFQA